MANNLIQIKRTSVSGRAANTNTLPNPGELALNMADGILYSTNGSFVFEIGANNTLVNVTNSISVGDLTINTSAFAGNNYNNPALFVPNKSDPYWSFGSFANSSDFFMQTRFWGGGDTHHGFRIFDTNGNTVPFKVDGTGSVYINKLTANGSLGNTGQVLTSNGSTIYWADATGGGSTFPYLDYGYIADTPPINVSSPIDYGSL